MTHVRACGRHRCRWLDEGGNPWPDLVDNRGHKWTKEEAEALIQEGSVVSRLAPLPSRLCPGARGIAPRGALAVHTAVHLCA